jgi:hypothetical protein
LLDILTQYPACVSAISTPINKNWIRILLDPKRSSAP